MIFISVIIYIFIYIPSIILFNHLTMIFIHDFVNNHFIDLNVIS